MCLFVWFRVVCMVFWSGLVSQFVLVLGGVWVM